MSAPPATRQPQPPLSALAGAFSAASELPRFLERFDGAALVQRAGDLDWDCFGELHNLGITAGASAPETLVEEIIGAFAERYSVSLETVSAANEDVFFPLPRPLRNGEAAG